MSVRVTALPESDTPDTSRPVPSAVTANAPDAGFEAASSASEKVSVSAVPFTDAAVRLGATSSLAVTSALAPSPFGL